MAAAALLYGLLSWSLMDEGASSSFCDTGDDVLAWSGVATLIVAVGATVLRAHRRGWRPWVTGLVAGVAGGCLAVALFLSWLAATFSSCFVF